MFVVFGHLLELSFVFGHLLELSFVFGHLLELSFVFGHLLELSFVFGHLLELSFVFGHLLELSFVHLLIAILHDQFTLLSPIVLFNAWYQFHTSIHKSVTKYCQNSTQPQYPTSTTIRGKGEKPCLSKSYFFVLSGYL